MSEEPITMYRQGDLLFCLVTGIPENVVKSESNIILQSSSISNPHTLKDGIYYKIVEDENSRWRRSVIIGFIDARNNKSKILHSEHPSLKLPEGLYEVRRQREGNGFVID